MSGIPENERERYEELLSYEILDSPKEPAFDDLARLAADLCSAPCAFVTLVDRDREWFKATFGVDPELREVPRDGGFCAQAILKPVEPFIIEDATQDARFANNPAVTGPMGLRFYAGVVLVNENGFALGTLSVVDTKPRGLSPEELDRLTMIARLVTDQLELRRSRADVETASIETVSLQQRIRVAEQTSNLPAGSFPTALDNLLQNSDRVVSQLQGKLAELEAGAKDEATLGWARSLTQVLSELLVSLAGVRAGHEGLDQAASKLEEALSPVEKN